MVDKPPLGLEPRYIHEAKRIVEIIGAMNRYMKAGKMVPKEWYDEAFELAEKQ